MIRPIDIRLNAAHPELPLAEAVTFTGAPSTVLIRGVPPNCGRWAITAVFVAATYPDGSTTTRAAVQSANGVWVATLPATARSGRTENGLRVMADGIDENGAAVTGYILGVADFAVASLGVTPAPQPGETSWQMLYFDEVPGTLRKGDVAKVDGVLKLYNGTAWEAFAAPVTFDDTVTRTSANGVKSSGIWSALWGALSALPTGFTSLYDWCVSQLAGKMPSNATGADIAVSGTDVTKISAALAGKASTADATLTKRFSEWTILRDGVDVTEQVQQPYWEVDPDAAHLNQWVILGTYVQGDFGESTITTAPRDAVALSWYGVSDGNVRHPYAARRTALQGYQLGPDEQTNPNRDKPLASEAEAEALRTGKLDKSGGTFGATTISLSDEGIVVSDTQSSNSTLLSSSYNFLTHRDGLGVRYFAAPSTSGTLALTADIPYDLGTPIVINAASSETVEGETVNYGAATLANRTANIVQVTAATALDELRITFPAATSGKVRDFGLRVEIGTGSAALTAPALVPIAPTGETIKIENNAKEIPALADGTATAKGVTLLYFSENAPGIFVVKGEQVEEVA